MHILCSHFTTSTPTISAADALKLATCPAVEVGLLLLVFITIAGIAYIALFDTGAAISTINSQALMHLPEEPVVRNCDHIEIKAWNGTVSPCQGMVHVTMHEGSSPSVFTIAPESQFSFIIGNNIIDQLGPYTV